jgi:protein TonB
MADCKVPLQESVAGFFSNQLLPVRINCMKKVTYIFLACALTLGGLHAALKPVQLIESIQPAYPDELKASGEIGEVKIRATIDESGNVSRAEVVSATHPAFAQSAMEAIRKWRFKPAREEGKAVSQTVVIPMVFRLTLEDRLNAVAGYVVFVNTAALPDKVHTWKDVQRYFALKKKHTRRIPYPEVLKGSGISEEITIQCIVSPEGYPLNPKIENLQNKELAIPALEHLVSLRFDKPKLGGNPIYLQQKIKLLASEDPAFGAK